MGLFRILVVIVVIAAVAFGAYVLYRGFTEDKPYIDVATETVGAAQGYVTQNLPTVIAAGGTVTAIGGAALSKINTAKQTAQDAQETLGSYRTKYDALNESVTQKETEIASLKTQLTEAAKAPPVDTDLISQYENQIVSLKAQVQGSQEQSTNFVKGLMQAANGALITAPDGKIYSVLKVPPEIQVR